MRQVAICFFGWEVSFKHRLEFRLDIGWQLHKEVEQVVEGSSDRADCGIRIDSDLIGMSERGSR